MKKLILIIFAFLSFAQIVKGQTTELEKELIQALYECRADFYELAENYTKLDSIQKNRTRAAQERAERAEAKAQELAEEMEKQKTTTRKRTRQRNAATLSTLIMVILHLLNR